MKKQELVHLHGLIAEVTEFCGEDISLNLGAYRSLETRPTSIHHSKGAHKDAVLALIDDITSTLRNGSDEQIDPISDNVD